MFAFNDDLTPPWYFIQAESHSSRFSVSPEFKKAIESNGWKNDNSSYPFFDYVNEKMYCHGYMIGTNITLSALDMDNPKSNSVGEFYPLYSMALSGVLPPGSPSLQNDSAIVIGNYIRNLGNKLTIDLKVNVQNQDLLIPTAGDGFTESLQNSSSGQLKIWNFSVGFITEDKIPNQYNSEDEGFTLM